MRMPFTILVAAMVLSSVAFPAPAEGQQLVAEPKAPAEKKAAPADVPTGKGTITASPLPDNRAAPSVASRCISGSTGRTTDSRSRQLP